ncbi:YCF48-related protein [Piscinibacter sakaiensis]|uniref:PKD domain-containing protein n=1 Tax=Piscinibacter sakaiensis TaxID=1547922 RepID=A0A0K8P615_PISS1|nr:YCF48-related protein [Piscinibacter sakaiensis]GAP38026.1 hypothetical protein ISF6_4220 [Piscinibacter sakaiensis]
MTTLSPPCLLTTRASAWVSPHAMRALPAWALAVSLAGCGGSDEAAVEFVPAFSITGATAQAEVGAPLALGSGLSSGLAGLSYRWDFGDGTTSLSASPQKAYASPGRYTVSLTIRSASGDTKTATAEVVAGRFALVQGQRCLGDLPGAGWCRPARLPDVQGEPFFVDASYGWAIGSRGQRDDRGQIYRSADGGRTWTAHPIATTTTRALVFADATVGAALADGERAGDTELWATRDGGRTWSRAGLLPPRTDADETPPTPVSISPDGMRIVLQRARNPAGFPPEPRKPEGLYLSRDGGASWSTIGTASAVTPDGTLFELAGRRVLRGGGPAASPTSSELSEAQSLRLVAFADDRRGFVFGSTVGSGVAVWQTMDGGAQWRRVDLLQAADRPTSMAFSLLAFADEALWIRDTDANGADVLYRSGDGGASWRRVAAPSRAPDAFVQSPTPVTGRLAHAAVIPGGPGGLAAIPVTWDGGDSWLSLSSLPALPVRRWSSSELRLAFPGGSSSTPWLSYRNTWYAALDGGARWMPVLGFGDQLPGSTTGLVVDGFDRLVTGAEGSVDGGRTWTDRSARAPFNYARRHVQFGGGGVGWAVSDDAGPRLPSFHRTTDHGQTWQEDLLPPAGSSAVAVQTRGLVSFIGPAEGWAYRSGGGFSALWKTEDGGLSWRHLGSGPAASGAAAVSMAFATPRVGAMTLDDGSAWRTQDGGVTWQASAAATPGSGSDVLLVDERLGFLVGRALRRTEDGGATWTTVLSSAPAVDPSFVDIAFADARTGWIAQRDGSVLATRDGGRSWTRQETGNLLPPARILALDTRTVRLVNFAGEVFTTVTGGD